MTNDKLLEEIIHKAYELGIEKELFNAAQQLIETGGFDRHTAYENAYRILTSRK
jgi:hypothetical protein